VLRSPPDLIISDVNMPENLDPAGSSGDRERVGESRQDLAVDR